MTETATIYVQAIEIACAVTYGTAIAMALLYGLDIVLDVVIELRKGGR